VVALVGVASLLILVCFAAVSLCSSTSARRFLAAEAARRLIRGGGREGGEEEEEGLTDYLDVRTYMSCCPISHIFISRFVLLIYLPVFPIPLEVFTANRTCLP
jgi:hypothetical protein